MCIKMERANVRIGGEDSNGISFYYFQIEIDGKLKVNPRYGSSMASNLISGGLLPVAIVRGLSKNGVSALDYNLIDGEIIEESGDKKRISPLGRVFASDLTQKINMEFARAVMGN